MDTGSGPAIIGAMTDSQPDEVRALLDGLRVDGDAVLVPVKAHPGARREGVEGVHAGALKVSCRAAPDQGKATIALGALLARLMGVAPSQVVCVKGVAARDKVYAVRSLDLEGVRRVLAQVLAGGAP